MYSANKCSLKGFFVSDVCTWTYEDTLRSDAENLRRNPNSTQFQRWWGTQARQQGYITIVQIAGFGLPD